MVLKESVDTRKTKVVAIRETTGVLQNITEHINNTFYKAESEVYLDLLQGGNIQG